MAKEALKQEAIDRQGGIDPLTDLPLPLKARTGPAELELVDTDRIKPKADGGTYDDPDNVRVVDPRAHMARHGNLRERTEKLTELKSVFDDRVQVMRLRLKVDNQLRAFERRTDDSHPETAAFLQDMAGQIKGRQGDIDRAFARLVKQYGKVDLLTGAALGVRGVGPITAGALAVYIDLEKAEHPSSLWAYCGYDKASHERYEKGVKGGGNKTLRTVLFNFADGVVKDKLSPYRSVYDRTKMRLSSSRRVTKSRNTQGKLIECAWQDTKAGHRHGAAMRAVIKHFLVDYYVIGRTIAGLPVSQPYVQDKLGHQGIMPPSERGWVLP